MATSQQKFINKKLKILEEKKKFAIYNKINNLNLKPIKH